MSFGNGVPQLAHGSQNLKVLFKKSFNSFYFVTLLLVVSIKIGKRMKEKKYLTKLMFPQTAFLNEIVAHGTNELNLAG